MPARPNFFLVGAPKCGTSAMRTYLSQHPEVFFAVPDEPGYFDGPLRFVEKRDYQFKTQDEYLKIYRGAEPQKHRIRGEGSVYIMYTPGAIQRILEMTPGAKFLVMLRNPVDAFISMHGENLKSPKLGREPFAEIEEAWSDLPRRASESAMAGVHPFRFRYDCLFRYFEPVKRLMESIPRGDLKVVLYDDFRKDNVGVFHEVCEFLDIAADFQPQVRRINERSQSRNNLAATVTGVVAQLARRLPVLNSLRGRGLALNRFTQMPLEKPVLSDEFFSEVQAFFKSDIEMLASLIDSDLSGWSEGDNRYRASINARSAA